MWALNNRFLVMKPDTCHPSMGGIMGIHHQEKPGMFLAVESELKGNLLSQKETNMCAKDHTQHRQDIRAQPEIPVTQK